MSRKSVAMLVVLLLVAVTVLGCAGQREEDFEERATGENVITLRLGHDQPEAHGYHKGALFFAEKVKEKTGGRVEIKVFPNAVLGNEMNMLDSVRLGDLDFSISAAPNAATHVPELGFFSVSYLFEDKAHFIRTMTDSQFTSDVSQIVESHNLGIRPIAFLTAGLRSVYTSKGPITTADEVKGLKIRVLGSPIAARVWRELDALPVSMPFGEIYTALQTGVVEAAEGSPSSYGTAKHYEVAPYLSLTQHEWLVSVLWVSDKTWSNLPDDVKEAIISAGREMTRYEIDFASKQDEEMVKTLQEKYNVKVNEVNQETFKEKLLPLQDAVAKELKTEHLLARIRDLAR